MIYVDESGEHPASPLLGETQLVYVLSIIGNFIFINVSNCIILFNSLAWNKIGKDGAGSLGDALRVNHSLKTLK